MAIIYPKSQLTILEYNRLVKDMNGYTVEDILLKLDHDFIVQKLENN